MLTECVNYIVLCEFSSLFYLMPTSRCDALQLGTGKAWAVSSKKRFRANFLVWGLPKSFTKLEISSKFVDIGLANFVRGIVCWEGDHVRLVRIIRDSQRH